LRYRPEIVLCLQRVARTIKFLPLTFVAGAWGFNFFVPYLLIFMMAVGVTGRIRRIKPQLA
jgi:hypothetical protein